MDYPSYSDSDSVESPYSSGSESESDGNESSGVYESVADDGLVTLIKTLLASLLKTYLTVPQDDGSTKDLVAILTEIQKDIVEIKNRLHLDDE